MVGKGFVEKGMIGFVGGFSIKANLPGSLAMLARSVAKTRPWAAPGFRRRKVGLLARNGFFKQGADQEQIGNVCRGAFQFFGESGSAEQEIAAVRSQRQFVGFYHGLQLAVSR